MQDLQAKLEKLLLEAEDCELIATFATDIKKRVFFANLAVQLRALARDLDTAIKLQSSKDAA
jgi:hypothetical protein